MKTKVLSKLDATLDDYIPITGRSSHSTKQFEEMMRANSVVRMEYGQAARAVLEKGSHPRAYRAQ